MCYYANLQIIFQSRNAYICLILFSLLMKVLIILGHPNTGSFNHALAEACKAQILNNGHSVVFHDLYQEQFNPFLNTLEQSKVIEQHCSELVNCDGIIIIHPNWWGQPPAIVKGWLEQVFLPDVAYTFINDGNGGIVPKGLLKAQVALVLNTSNTSQVLEEEIYKDPLETIWKNRVFNFCGISNFTRKNFKVIKDSDLGQRNAWLSEVKQLVDSNFPSKLIN